MKNYILTGILVVILASCSTKNTINVTIKGVPDGRKAYLKKQKDRKIIVLDSTVIKNEKFGFNFTNDEPIIVGIFVDSIKQGLFPLVSKNDIVHITAQKDSLFFAKITGSKLNDELTSLRKFRDSVGKQIMALSAPFRKAQQAKDTITLKKLNDQARKIQGIINKHDWDYIKANPNSYVSPLVLSGLVRDFMYKDSVKMAFDKLSEKVKSSEISKGLREYFEKNKPKK